MNNLQWYFKPYTWLFVVGTFVISQLCCGMILNATGVSKVSVNDLVLSEVIDTQNKQAINPTTRFPATTTTEIFASFYLVTDDNIPITIAWYENGRLLGTQNFTSNSSWLAAQIHPKEKQFGIGQGKVEIWFGELLLEEKTFEVY